MHICRLLCLDKFLFCFMIYMCVFNLILLLFFLIYIFTYLLKAFGYCFTYYHVCMVDTGVTISIYFNHFIFVQFSHRSMKCNERTGNKFAKFIAFSDTLQFMRGLHCQYTISLCLVYTASIPSVHCLSYFQHILQTCNKEVFIISPLIQKTYNFKVP